MKRGGFAQCLRQKRRSKAIVCAAACANLIMVQLEHVYGFLLMSDEPAKPVQKTRDNNHIVSPPGLRLLVLVP